MWCNVWITHTYVHMYTYLHIHTYVYILLFNAATINIILFKELISIQVFIRTRCQYNITSLFPFTVCMYVCVCTSPSSLRSALTYLLVNRLWQDSELGFYSRSGYSININQSWITLTLFIYVSLYISTCPVSLLILYVCMCLIILLSKYINNSYHFKHLDY